MPELAVRVPAPGVDLAEGRFGYAVAETALDRVNALASLLEASDQLWDVVRVPMAKSELSVLIFLPDCIDESLVTDKEAKIKAAGDALDLDLFAEGHKHW